MALEILRKVGLSAGEISVYSVLIDLGASPVNRIHERTGIERRNIYDILSKLIERGLVSYITENRRKLFSASHPNKILEYIESRKSQLDQTRNEIEKSVPQLVRKFNAKRAEISAEIYRGIEGMKAAWEDMIIHGDIMWIGAGRYMPNMYPNFFAGWNRRRIISGVRIFNLLRFELKGKTKKMKLEHMRFLPKEFSGDPAVVGIYGDKVGNFLFGKDLFVFVINSKEIADSYRLYHKYLWDNVAISP